MTVTTTPAQPASAPAPSWLGEAAQTVTPALRQAVGTLHPDLERMAAYHKGWADADGQPVVGQSAGKGVRPALALWSAQAAGASPDTGLPAAVAVELVHDFSLLHDDIMDNDRTRRGRPTVWAVYGEGPAILLGDALHALAQITLAAAGPHGARAAGRLAHAIVELCQGQAADLEFERREQVSVQEYLGMVDNKTGALMRAATTLGAVLGGAEAPVAAELDRLGLHLGVLFQVVDDLLGVFGDPAVTGKPVGSDLARRKKTLPILAALASSSAQGRELAELMRQPDLSEPDLQRGTALIDQAGGRDRAHSECRWHHQQASAALTRLHLDSSADAMMRDLLSFLLHRAA